jgi:chromosome segregation ATPase
LEADRGVCDPEEQIHIRIGLHTGLGLIKDNDIFGDVVNAASRIQHQAEPDQILITDELLEAARATGVQCVWMRRAEMRGKDEMIDVYAVAWSDSASKQLIESVQDDFERKLKQAKQRTDELEEEFETARDQWRNERRRLSREVDQLEEAVELARQGARSQVVEDLQAEIKFKLDEAIHANQALEQEIISLQAKWDIERDSLKAQIATMQGAALAALERSNNPTRQALAVREQVDMRIKEAKEDWALQWQGERRRLNAEIERLKKAAHAGDKREAARKAVLEKLGKIPPGSSGSTRNAAQLEQEFESAKMAWESERDQLTIRLERLEREARKGTDSIRNEVFQEYRQQYEPKLTQADNEKNRLETELSGMQSQFAEERERLTSRIEKLEESVIAAQEAARTQAHAELASDYENKSEELNRIKARIERRFQESTEEWDSERRRLKKQISSLEEELKEAKDVAFKAQRSASRGRPRASEEE